jgi:hypothetical protein
MANVTVGTPGLDTNNPSAGNLELYKKVFAGEILTAMARSSKTKRIILSRTVSPPYY